MFVIRLLSKLKILCVRCHLLIHKQLNPTVEFNPCEECLLNVFATVYILFSFLAVLSLTFRLSSSCVSQQLLALVQQKAMVGVVDSTLKFALSALWNLTDEMPSAARNFIECQGLELYEEVLEVRRVPEKIR